MGGWNGSGSFERDYSWVADAAAGLDISASRMDTDTDNITANGFGNTLTRDGQGSATANQPMNTFRHTNVGNGVAQTDYAALGQVLSGSITWAVAGGTSDAITAGYSPAITTLLDGQLCCFRASAANATTTPTFTPNSGPVTPYVITKSGGLPVFAGDIPGALAEVILRYNLVNTRWELLNPAQNTKRTPVNDTNYNQSPADRTIAYTTITAARTIGLLAASAFGSGARLFIIDESGSASKTNTITPIPNGTDNINGANSGNAAQISSPYGSVTLESNGTNAWTTIGLSLGSLPTTLPASAGLLWNNGGVVSVS